VQRARKVLAAANGQSLERRSITLLDRKMARLLYGAIFSQSRLDLFKSDWDPAETANDATKGIFVPHSITSSRMKWTC